MQRTDLQDTKEWVHAEIVRRLRAMTPAERLALVFERVEMGRQIDRLAKARLAEHREGGEDKA